MMSALANRRRFDSSSLPPELQLKMHVRSPVGTLSGDLDFTKDVILLEELAEATQNVFLKEREGWDYGPVRDDANHIHNLILDYVALPEWAKEANRANVRWIPQKLAEVNCEMARAGNGQTPTLTSQEWDKLARKEHEIWMQRKEAQGYRYGPVAMESPKRSPYLVDWEQLPPHAQDLDRAFSKAIPQILAKAGYIFVRTAKRPKRRSK